MNLYNSRQETRMPIILAGAGIFALIVFFLVLFSGGRKEEVKTDPDNTLSLENRLKHAEARIGELERMVVAYEARIDQLEQTLPGISDQVTEQILRQLNERKAGSEKVTTVPAKPVQRVSPKIVKEPAQAPVSDPEFHVVAPGETLFKISRRYGIEIETLRRINNMTDNDIYPKQKIRLK